MAQFNTDILLATKLDDSGVRRLFKDLKSIETLVNKINSKPVEALSFKGSKTGIGSSILREAKDAVRDITNAFQKADNPLKLAKARADNFGKSINSASIQAQIFNDVLTNIEATSSSIRSQEVVNLADAWAQATASVEVYANRVNDLKEARLQRARQQAGLPIGPVSQLGTLEADVARVNYYEEERLKIVKNREKLDNSSLKSTYAQIQAQKQLAEVEKQRAAQARKDNADRAKRFESIALGVGFPLLFGAGGGSVLGSLAGSFAGKGFGGQILGGAVGQIFDDLAARTAELGRALNPLTADIDLIIERVGLVGTETATYIKALEDADQSTEALAAATRELEAIIGRDGVNALQGFGDQTQDFANQWQIAMTQMGLALSALLSGPLGAVLANLERANALRSAQSSNDPVLQDLLRQRNEAGRPGIFGGGFDNAKSQLEINDQIVQRTRELANERANALKEIEKSNELDLTSLNLLEAQIALEKTNGDLTNAAVFALEEKVIRRQAEVDLQAAGNDQTKIETAQLQEQLRIIQLKNRADAARAKAAAASAKIAEAEQKRVAVLQAQVNTAAALLAIDKQIAAAQVDGDTAKLAELEFTRALEASELKIAEIRARGAGEAETQLQIQREELRSEDELVKLDTKHALARKDLAKSFQATIDGLTIELGLAQAVTREEENRLKLQQKRLSLQGKGLNEDEVNQILELEGRLQAAQAPIQQYMTQLEKSLNDTEGQIVRMAQTIETELGSAMSSAITGVITGTQTVEEAFSQMFANIGKAFIDMATQMLAQQLILSVLKGLTGPSFGGLPGFGMEGTLAGEGVFTGAGPFQFRAEGGPVSAGQPYVVGEQGPELFVPGSGGNVVANDIFDATRQALTSGGGTDQAFSENSEALAVANSYTRERMFERERQTMLTGAGGSTTVQTQVINSVEYATIDQVQEVANLSAKKARAQVFSDMRNRPSTRASLGMG